MNLLGLRLLLVEDDNITRTVASAKLREVGIVVTEAQDGAEALQWLNDPPDVLFTDIRLPGSLDGWEVARQFRMRYPDLLLVYGTAYPMTEFPLEGSLFFQKPYDFSAIIEGIAGMTGRGRAIANLVLAGGRSIN
jgi:CheY-like chemotaxis protein